jgi:hypothetical protein
LFRTFHNFNLSNLKKGDKPFTFVIGNGAITISDRITGNHALSDFNLFQPKEPSIPLAAFGEARPSQAACLPVLFVRTIE